MAWSGAMPVGADSPHSGRRRVLRSSTPRSLALRSRFAALSARTFPGSRPARTLEELTTEHLEYLRPKFFEGGRFSRGPGMPRPVPLRLGREAFSEAVQPVMQLDSHDSLLQLFSRMEVVSGGGGVTWNALVTFVRQSIEGTGLGVIDDPQPACQYHDWTVGKEPVPARGTVQRTAGVEKCYLTIVGALDLAVADENTGSSDPTALVFWNGEKVFESSTKFTTLRPVWRETVMLTMPEDPMGQNELCVELYDRDAGSVYGDFLGRVLLVGTGPAGLSMGDKTLAFKLQPDPLKDDNSFVQGVLAIQVHDRDPATAYSVPDYVDLTEEIAASRDSTLAVTGVVESVTTTVGRAEQLRSQGYDWDHIIKVLEREYDSRTQRGFVPADQKLWWQSERQPRNEVMGAPKFLPPSVVPDEDGHCTVGCKTHYMVDGIGILDQYDCYFTACRGGTVRLWDAVTMQPANPPTVEPPLASNRPILADSNRECFINAKLKTLETELQLLRVPELKRRADAAGIEEKLIERAVDQAQLDAMAAEGRNIGGVTTLTAEEKDAERFRTRDKERKALTRLILDRVKENTMPEADLNFELPRPGILHQRAQPRGLSKHRQCWILDAATLQSPPGWADREFYRNPRSNAGKGSTANGGFSSLSGMGGDKKKSIGVAASRANAGTGGEQHFSMPVVAGPPKINPVVFICADNTIRLWSRRPAKGYQSARGELEGYWCKQRPEAGKTTSGHVRLSERDKALDIACQLDCIPTCIARAKPGAIAATWLNVEEIWSYVPRIVIGASDGTIRTWQVKWDGDYYSIEKPTHLEHSVAKFHDSAVLTCLRATESYILSGGQDCGVVLGDHHRWEPIWSAREHTEGVSCIDFDIMGKTFVSGGDDRLVALWDVSVGPKSVATLPKSYGAPVVGVSFSDGHPHLLSVAYANQTVQLWDTRRTPICLQEAVDKSSHATSTASTDTDKYTASCFDQASHSMICAGTHAVSWRIRPKKPTLWSKHWRHKVRLVLVFLRWYCRHRKKRMPTTHSAPVLLVEFVPKIDAMITLDVNGVIRLWDVDAAANLGTAVDDGPQSCIAEFSAFGTRIGGDTPLVERLTAAIVLPCGAGNSAGDLMTASQTGKLAVHSMTASAIQSLTIGVPQSIGRDTDASFNAGDKGLEAWDGVPCEVSDMSFTSGLQGTMRNRPVLLLGHDGTVWLCPHQKILDARGRTTLAKPLQLIHSSVPAHITSLTGPGGGQEDTPVATTVCAYETRNVGGGPHHVVLVGCRVRNKAGEAVIRAFERGSVNRPAFAIGAFSTPPQPDRRPQDFGDYRTCEYRYDPELAKTVYLIPEGHESKAEGAGWIVPNEDAYQGGLLLVVRNDGVMHVVDMQRCDTVESFAVNIGGCPVVDIGGFEDNERLLICGNIDGFARILFIAGGPQTARSCMKEAAAAGERGGIVNVRRTWRAHTSQITQAKVARRGRGHDPYFCTAAADGSVKLWGLDGSPIFMLGMVQLDETVRLASAKFRASAERARAAVSAATRPNRAGAPSGSTSKASELITSLVDHAAVAAGDHAVQRQERQERKAHQPTPPPGRRRKAGRVAKLVTYVETSEAAIKGIGQSYRADAAGRAAASARRAFALAGQDQGH